MTDQQDVPARELSDAELEHQGEQAHATRHWVFLYGTAEQFRTRTQRMLQLEQKYLRRHPQRTWQGTGGAEDQPASSVVRDAKSALLAAFADARDGSLHKLEAHQIARRVAPNARLAADLYKQDPPQLHADGDYRAITEASRAWLAEHPA